MTTDNWDTQEASRWLLNTEDWYLRLTRFAKICKHDPDVMGVNLHTDAGLREFLRETAEVDLSEIDWHSIAEDFCDREYHTNETVRILRVFREWWEIVEDNDAVLFTEYGKQEFEFWIETSDIIEDAIDWAKVYEALKGE